MMLEFAEVANYGCSTVNLPNSCSLVSRDFYPVDTSSKIYCVNMDTLSNISSTQQSLTPVTETSEGGNCSACHQPITDRYYLYALGQQWHNACLRCVSCESRLEEAGSCYVRDGFIYCKQDYIRQFGTQKCSRCSSQIKSGELVMRAAESVYHVSCFTCQICNCLLQTGDHFGIYDDKIYCKPHYEQLQYSLIQSAQQSLHIPQPQHVTTHQQDIPPTQSRTNNVATTKLHMEHFPPIYNTTANTPDFGQQPIKEQTTPTKTKSKSRKKAASGVNDINSNNPWTGSIAMMDGERTGFPSCQGGQSQIKQKRMRTSFKHHQLKVMKLYFQQENHNPDAKDLKQLSQKTGLSKRVLQVWFQNARAKFRRGITDKDDELEEEFSKQGEEDGEDNSMGLPTSPVNSDTHGLEDSDGKPTNNNVAEKSELHFNQFSPTQRNTSPVDVTRRSDSNPVFPSFNLSPASTQPHYTTLSNQNTSLLHLPNDNAALLQLPNESSTTLQLPNQPSEVHVPSTNEASLADLLPNQTPEILPVHMNTDHSLML